MNTDSSARGAGTDQPAARQPADSREKTTPNADMQAEDAGTADSGNDAHDDSGSAATRAMKQTSKTPAESGGKR